MTEGNAGQVSRRGVLVGAAWATPVVLVAASAPASAASQVADHNDSVIVVSSQDGGTGWGNDNSVGVELTYFYAYNAEWQQAGVTSLTSHITVTATQVSTGESKTQTSTQVLGMLPDGSTGTGSFSATVSDLPPGEYTVSYVITSDPVTSEVNGETYQATPVMGGPYTAVI